MPQHIIVVDYDPAWEQAYQAEEQLIREILKENCVQIHHIGSTSVPGLAAKPIIDILVSVRSLEGTDGAAEAFGEAGYEYLGEFGIPGRRYLRKGGDERTHQIHIFAESDRENLDRHLAFRDFLRTHEKEREAYGALKKDLAERYPYDIDGYCDGKDAFVKEMEARALAVWRGGQTKEEVSCIRPMERRDLDQVAQIWLETNCRAHAFIPASYWEDNLESVKKMLPLAEVYVREEKGSGKIQGFIGLDQDYIEGIFVCGKAQSRGIGKELLDFVKARRETLTLSVYEKNTGAIRFYRREGFAVRQEGMDEQTGEREFTMEWKRS